MSMKPPARLERPRARTAATRRAEPPSAASSTARKLSASGVIVQERIATAGTRKTATWAPEERAISAARRSRPRPAVTAEHPPGGDDVGDEQNPGDGKREDGERVAVGVAVEARDCGNEEEGGGEHDEAEPCEGGAAVDRP